MALEVPGDTFFHESVMNENHSAHRFQMDNHNRWKTVRHGNEHDVRDVRMLVEVEMLSLRWQSHRWRAMIRYSQSETP